MLLVEIKYAVDLKNLNISLFLKDITKGADLTIVFMDELNEETWSMSYYYYIADKKTTIFINRPVLLLCHIWFVMFQCYTVRP